MSERRNPREQDPTQQALEAASQALAAANAAVQAAFKALALSSSRRYEDDDRLDRRVGSIRRAASQARRSAGGEASGEVPLSHPPAKVRAKKPIAEQASPGPTDPVVDAPVEPQVEEVPFEPPAIDAPAPPGNGGRSAFAARKHGVDGAATWPGSPENGVSHDTSVRPVTEANPEQTESAEQPVGDDHAVARPAGAGPIYLGPSTALPPEEAVAFPPPFVEDVVIPLPVFEAPAVPHLDDVEVEIVLHEAELHARELEIEAREAAMALYAPMEPPRRVAAKPQAELNGYTVLVVDDEEQVRALTVRILSRYGYHVLEASGVEIALRLLDEPTADVDLVLSDVAMPGLSGKDLFLAISESRPGLPVVFMSGYALGVYAPEGLVEEGVKMLPKPFTQEDLLEFVTEALEGAAAR